MWGSDRDSPLDPEVLHHLATRWFRGVPEKQNKKKALGVCKL